MTHAPSLVHRRVLRLVDRDDDDDDDDGTGGLRADASRSPMGTLPFAMMPPPPPAKRLTANVDEFTLHADTAVAAYDRDGLERLARYGARPPFAHRRLRLTPSGQVAYRLRRPWFTGQTCVGEVRTRSNRDLHAALPTRDTPALHDAFARARRCAGAAVARASADPS